MSRKSRLRWETSHSYVHGRFTLAHPDIEVLSLFPRSSAVLVMFRNKPIGRVIQVQGTAILAVNHRGHPSGRFNNWDTAIKAVIARWNVYLSKCCAGQLSTFALTRQEVVFGWK